MPPPPATIVLVHGAWHHAGCWSRVGHLLGAARVPWRALTLPSTGPAPGPGGGRRLAGFGDDVAAVLALVDEVGGEVVLCGHGYGGMVISEAGNHPAVSRLVYLAAFCPRPGETVNHLMAQRWPAPGMSWPAHQVRHGRSTVSARWARRWLYSDLPPGPAADLAALLRPSAASIFEAPAVRPAWLHKPSLYALCARDRVVGVRRSRAMADRLVRIQIGWGRYQQRNAVTLHTGHAPFHSAPDLVADVLRGRF